MNNHILVCVDLKSLSRRVLLKAVELGKQIGGEIFLVHVRDSSPTSSHATANHSGRTAEELIRENNELEKLEEILRDSGLKYRVDQPTGDIVPVMTETIAAWKPQMVVMGSAHNSALHHVVSGSVAGAILEKTGVPVLLVPEER